jgi:acetaldehyde dehydrogenase (acetylating)
MSLGCGAYAGNITSDNITPLHLINVKRLAYELPREARAAAMAGAPLRDQVASFVQEKLGAAPPVARPAGPPAPPAPPRPVVAAPPPAPALDFVAEDDVKRALREGRTLRVSRKAIITPAARDAAGDSPVLVVE